MTRTLRVLIADDHPVFRKGLRALITSVSGVELVGEASDGEEAVALATTLVPDVAVMDLTMPGTNGIEATRRILTASPSVGVLMLTMFEDDDSLFAAMRAGARGYVVKGSDTDEVLAAITAVARGEAIFSPTVASRILSFLTDPLSTHDQLLFPELSAREREVLDLIAAGIGNAEIAKRLFLSPKTVRNHVSNVFAKLQVADRAQAIVRARAAGLGQGSDDPS